MPAPRQEREPVVADAMLASPKLHDVSVTVGELRSFFDDDHVHTAIIVADDGTVLTAVERSDLVSADAASAAHLEGMLEGRTTAPHATLSVVWDEMLVSGRRRLVVVDDDRKLVGLLCLKHHGRGFCSDDDVVARRRQA